MEKSVGETYADIDGARIEGRFENVMTRKKQLLCLYNKLQSSTDRIIAALIQDLSWKEIDALLELSIALQTLRRIYDDLDFKTTLETEQLLEKNKSNTGRRDPLGNILIMAESAAPISQCIIPLALAIAAGNTVLLLLSHSSPVTSEVLATIILSATDNEAVGVIHPKNTSEFGQFVQESKRRLFHGVVLQRKNATSRISSALKGVHSIHNEPRQACAIVTRSSNIRKAAQEIARAKFAYFAGSSPCAPGLVLVDEFIINDFVAALERAVKSVMAEQNDPTIITNTEASTFITEQAETILFEGKGGRILKIPRSQLGVEYTAATLLVGDSEWKNVDNFPSLLSPAGSSFGYRSAVLPILPTTSMEVAMTIARNTAGDILPPVTYIFGSPEDCKYISLFVPCSATYINSIPLITAVAPYTPWNLQSIRPLFSQPHPVHIPASSPHAVSKVEKAISSGRGQVVGLKELIAAKLLPPKQRSGFQVGYFEQSALTGLAHWFTLFGVSGFGAWWVISKYLRRRFAK